MWGTIISTIVGAVISLIGSLAITNWYHKKAAKELNELIEKLKVDTEIINKNIRVLSEFIDRVKLDDIHSIYRDDLGNSIGISAKGQSIINQKSTVSINGYKVDPKEEL